MVIKAWVSTATEPLESVVITAVSGFRWMLIYDQVFTCSFVDNENDWLKRRNV